MKYKGFTLIEITLALSLTGIMLLLGGEVWQILSQIHALYADSQEQSYEAISLRSALTHDLNQYRNWRQIGQQWQADDSVGYYFREKAVIRRQGSKS
ncbi:MAG: prepilin-type N-terminal cleavage/methylation domain-containing protein, partial [Bacteroidota bacterium]